METESLKVSSEVELYVYRILRFTLQSPHMKHGDKRFMTGKKSFYDNEAHSNERTGMKETV